MIGLAAQTYDPSGAIIFRNIKITNPYSAQRRGTVTATLDGSVSVYDTGYSESDQTLSAIITYPKKNDLVTVKYLIAYYGQVTLSCETGCYSVVLQSAVTQEQLLLTMRVISRLDA